MVKIPTKEQFSLLVSSTPAVTAMAANCSCSCSTSCKCGGGVCACSCQCGSACGSCKCGRMQDGELVNQVR